MAKAIAWGLLFAVLAVTGVAACVLAVMNNRPHVFQQGGFAIATSLFPMAKALIALQENSNGS